jgi:hypothetical protein
LRSPSVFAISGSMISLCSELSRRIPSSSMALSRRFRSTRFSTSV